MLVLVASPAFFAIQTYLPRLLPEAEVVFADPASLPDRVGGRRC